MPLGSVQFGQGFASGMDYRAIIDAVLQAGRVPIDSIQDRIDTFERAKSSFSQFSGLLDDFVSKLEGLDDSAKLAGRSTSLSSSDALTAKATSKASAGSYQINVTQIAQAHRVRSDGLSDRYSPLVTDGTITIQAGGNNLITVNVSSANGNNSLQAIADEINNADEGVIATVINDGTSDILVVRSEETGTTHSLTITDTTNLNLDTAGNELQAAQDAVLDVDGVSITSSSNSVTGAIQGVTLSLTGTTSSAVTLTVSEDTETAKKSLQEFVDAYNEVNDYFDQQFGTPEFRAASAVAGSLTVRQVQLDLQSIVTGSVTGIPSGKLSSLSELGITFADDGTGRLEFEGSKFDALVDAGRFDEIAAVLMSTGSTTDSSVVFDSASSRTVAGTYAVTVTQAAERADVAGSTAIAAGGLSQAENLTIELNSSSLNVALAAGDTITDVVSKINSAFELNGMAATAYSSSGVLHIRADDYGDDYTIRVTSDVADLADGNSTGIGTTQLTDTGIDVAGSIGGQAAQGIGQQLIGADGTNMDGLIVTVYATAASITAKGGNFGTVGYSAGVIESFNDKIDGLTDPYEGVLKSIQDSYDDSIDVAERRIEALEAALARKEELMVRQFSAAEQAIAQLQQLQASLTSVPR
ncbi:MAG: flagellar filament capping protein FliD [Acidobacteriota bacterium]|nr:flagellar filament capping protein FliD [Acidobacteriota bacterium]